MNCSGATCIRCKQQQQCHKGLHDIVMPPTSCVLLQDAHEFLYFLFNEISEVLEKSEKEKHGASQNGSLAQADGKQLPPKTWVHELFQGTMVNEMRCMQCETVTSREEAFYDLSLEIEHNSSVTSCLRNFRSTLGASCDRSYVASCHLCHCTTAYPDASVCITDATGLPSLYHCSAVWPHAAATLDPRHRLQRVLVPHMCLHTNSVRFDNDFGLAVPLKP